MTNMAVLFFFFFLQVPNIGDSLNELFPTNPGFQTPGQGTPMVRHNWMPASEKKTPHCSMATPGLLKSVDRWGDWSLGCCVCNIFHYSVFCYYIVNFLQNTHSLELFVLKLRYAEQSRYRYGNVCWMTFPWSWPKAKAVALINKNLLVCMIKWEPLSQSLQFFLTMFS